MKKFMDENFLLTNPTGERLYHDYAKEVKIFDFHCHLSPREIWEDKKFHNITEVWLSGDHYKWRQLRSMGVDEAYITGTLTTAKEKFLAYARIMPYLLGNPLYHWTHLEMQRYFGITEILCESSAEHLWDEMNEQLNTDAFTVRRLIEKSNVYALCTTDDPADNLIYHQKIKAEAAMKTKVLPAMRPDKALNVEAKDFSEYINLLGEAARMPITSYNDLKEALAKRVEFFHAMGCRACDHALEYVPFEAADERTLEEVFRKALRKEVISAQERDQYKTDLLIFLAAEYKKREWAMEIHIGALRNNNQRMFQRLGPDTGFDSVNDYNYAPGLRALLSKMDEHHGLPKTILFTLNPKDYYVLTTMMGCFQGTEAASKIQSGSAWWFLDHKTGMEEQMRILAATGLLSKFIGMVTDSRSFLSYPRHEYFRRILCNMIGGMVENGEYPDDYNILEKMIQDICFQNAKAYIGIE